MTLAVVLGTKAELIKTMPVMKELDKRKIDYWFIHTGQHSLGELLEDFDLKEPDFVIYAPPKKSSRFMGKLHKALLMWFILIPKIWRLLRKLKPKYVIYHGDTLSAAAAAVATKFSGANGVHLEAGLRSGSIFEPFPEEISRLICDYFSSILLAVSDLTEANLKKARYGRQVVKVGNTIVDSVKLCRALVTPKKGNYVVVNVHRHENIKSKIRLRKIIDILAAVNNKIIWPIHDNTKHQLIKFGLWEKLRQSNIEFSSLKTYPEFISLLAGCKYIITDGGSIQEESLALGKPCILLRKRTERPEGLDTGLNFLTGLDFNKALVAIRRIEAAPNVSSFKNPYGDGKSAELIVDYLLEK